MNQMILRGDSVLAELGVRAATYHSKMVVDLKAGVKSCDMVPRSRLTAGESRPGGMVI